MKGTRPIGLLLGLCCLLSLSGCSIAMAVSGHQEPNFEAFEIGSTRKQVEIQLGIPVSTRTLEDGRREDQYKYETGNSPNGHRAMMNLYIDLYTIGLAEPILTVIELLQGDDQESQIIYTAEDRVAEIRGYRPPPPSAELKAAEEAQRQWEKRPQTVEPCMVATAC